MPDIKKTTDGPDEQGKDAKKVGEIKFKIPVPAKRDESIKPPGSFILETEITRQRSKTGAGPDEEGAEDTPAKPESQPSQQRPTPPAPTSPTPQPGSPKAPTPPAPPGPTPSTPPGPSPQTPSPGTMETGPRPQAPSQPKKPAGTGIDPVKPLGLGGELQERSKDAQGDQGPTEGTKADSNAEGGDSERNQTQAEPGNAQQQQAQIGMMGELAQQEASQKALLAQQIQSDERAAGRAHLIELIAQGIVTGLEFIDSLLKFLGNVAKPIPIIGWIVQIIVWIARAIVTVMEFLPKGVAKGERKDEDRLRLRASKLRKEASGLGTWGGVKLPPAPDNPHGAAEAPAEGLASDNVRLPVLGLLRPSTEPFNLLPGLFKINPPLAGILKIFIIAGTVALLLISMGGLVIFMQSSQA